MFWRLTDNMKGKYDTFSGYKQRNKLCFVYLDLKHQQRRSCWCIFKLKWQKREEKIDLETSKQQSRYRWCFYMLKLLRESNSCIFGLYSYNLKTSKYLGRKVDRRQKAKSGVEMKFCKTEMQHDRCCWCKYQLNFKEQRSQRI